MLHRTSRRSLLSKNLTFQAMSTGWVYPFPVVDFPYYTTHQNMQSWNSSISAQML